ncbi:MAG TPA: 7TM diverse intracellular signaling domain-containing protein, partial [Ramlibacter sp.]|nr:7TM diverse intracellular signaling domain-containing protein [Ramlibacter sp.]
MRLAAAVRLVAALLVLALCCGAHGGDAQIATLTRASILLDPGERIPADDAAWQPQALPDDWSRTRPGVLGAAWYRVEFDLPADRLQLSALYVPRTSMIGAVQVNGEVVGGTAEFDERASRQWYRPQLYAVPAKLLRPGRNTLHLRVQTYPQHERALSELHFGPSAAVEAQWRRRTLLQITTVQIGTAVTVGLGLVALLAWQLLGRDTFYLYFAAAAACSSLGNLQFLLTRIPLPPFWWEILSCTMLIWCYMLVGLFVLRFVGTVRADRFLLAACAAVPLVLWAGTEAHFRVVSSIVYALAFAASSVVLAVGVRAAHRQRARGTWLIVAAGVAIFPLMGYDWANYIGLTGFSD